MGDEGATYAGAGKGRTLAALTRKDVEARMAARTPPEKGIRAFYSSVYGGIVDEYALMAVPLDDHQVHRGHAIFDTCHIIGGSTWGLDAHLDRFMRSSRIARIDVARLPIFPGGRSAADLAVAGEGAEAAVRARVREILVELFAHSGVRDGMSRYWMSAGTGDFHVTPYDCVPSLYAMVVPMNWDRLMDEDGRAAVRVATTDVPMKPPPYCVVKSNNYLQNAHVQMSARDKGADLGVFTYTNGAGETCVAEGPTCNCVFADRGGKLVVPSFQYALRGVTLLRLIDLVERAEGLEALTGVEIREVRLAEVLEMAGGAGALAECFIVSSGNMGTTVSSWDGTPIAARESPCAKEVGRILRADMRPGGGSEFFEKIEYFD